MTKDANEMTDAITRDETMRLRQFWQRAILTIGILCGFMPFVLAPFIRKGPSDTYFDIIASIFNSLTLLPACTLAFWHRRAASVWLTINAVVIALALASFILRTRQIEVWMIVQVAGSVGFAVWLDAVEALRWPPPLDRKKAKAAESL